MLENKMVIDSQWDIPMEDEKPVFFCTDCGKPIYEGDRYLDIQGECHCKDCIESYFQIA